MILELCVVLPTLNERDNVRPSYDELVNYLSGIAWEVIFVDDGSQDGTVEEIEKLSLLDRRVRAIRRINRRGLSSACIEGMAASFAPYIAVMDSDLQHDPSLLPRMLEILKNGEVNIVIGSRYMSAGSTGEWSEKRRKISRFATRLGQVFLGIKLTDPMSGFFMLKRELFNHASKNLSAKGFKILLDVLTAAKNETKSMELPYIFRPRRAGWSKLDILVVYEYLLLLLDKLVGKYIPVGFIIFSLVGCIGALFHLSILGAFLKLYELPFYLAQGIASVSAIFVNFYLNNLFTHRSNRLKGFRFVKGLAGFLAICSAGAFANVQIAMNLFEAGVIWQLAGLLGAVIGAVWNYAVSKVLVWGKK